MKFFLKKITTFFNRGLIKFLFSFNAGRFLIDKITEVILCEKKKISHNNTNLEFCSPNRMNFYRIETFSTKEPDTLNWIDDFKKEKVFWDIGANVGLYTVYAALRRKCRVVAFEPSVFNLELLSRNLYLNGLHQQVTLLPLALADKMGRNLLRMTSTEWGGALSTFGADVGWDGHSIQEVFAFSTYGLSMDQAVEVLGMPAPHFIKMDVDGIEHLILEGGDKYLNHKKVKSLSIEINENFKEQYDKVLNLMNKYEFKLLHKKHNDYMFSEQSKFKNTYNYIFKKLNSS